MTTVSPSLLVLLLVSSCALAEYFISIKENFVYDPFGPDLLNCSDSGCKPLRGRSIFFYSRKRGFWYPQKPKAQRLVLTEDSSESLLRKKGDEIVLLKATVLCFNSDTHYSCSFVSAGTVKIPNACFQHCRFCSVSCPSTGETIIKEEETLSCGNLDWELWWKSSCSKSTKVVLIIMSSLTAFMLICIAVLLVSNRRQLDYHEESVLKEDPLSSDEEEIPPPPPPLPTERPVRPAHKKAGVEVRTTVRTLGALFFVPFLFVYVHAQIDNGVMTYDCQRLNGTTDECKVYFSHRIILHSVGESRTLILRGESNEEIQLHLHLTLEKTSFGLVHQYFTGEYKTAQASYARCVGATKTYCGTNPWQCTEFNSSDLSLIGAVELPYDFGKATCFVQPRAGCGSIGHQGCHYASWAIGSNCSDDLYSIQAPSFSATVNINGNDYKVGSTNQLDDFRVDLIGSFEGAMCQPGNALSHILLTDGKYYMVSATNANVGNPGQIGELQCDSSRKIKRFYNIPTLDTTAQDGHFYSFQQQSYQLKKSWKALPLRESQCLWNIEGPNLVGYSQSGSAIELEISSFGKFSILRQDVLCDPEIKNMWLEGCNNCTTGRLLCLEATNQWGACSANIKTNFETSWSRLNLDQSSQEFCLDVRNDTIKTAVICLDSKCTSVEVSWELEDLVESQNNSNADFKGKSIRWKTTATLGSSIVITILIAIIAVMVVIKILQTRKVKLQ